MRQLKIRGYSIALNKWIYGSLINNLWTKVADGSAVCEIITSELEEITCWQDLDNIIGLDVYPESVGQFTGLTDKNEKDAYEGDKIRCFIADEQVGANDVIVFKNGAFWLRARNITMAEWMSLPDMTYNTDFEIIGNIYESNL